MDILIKNDRDFLSPTEDDDTIFIVGPNSVKVYANKFILKLIKYFKDLFNSDKIQKENNYYIIKIPEFSETIITYFLKNLYNVDHESLSQISTKKKVYDNNINCDLISNNLPNSINFYAEYLMFCDKYTLIDNNFIQDLQNFTLNLCDIYFKNNNEIGNNNEDKNIKNKRNYQIVKEIIKLLSPINVNPKLYNTYHTIFIIIINYIKITNEIITKSYLDKYIGSEFNKFGTHEFGKPEINLDQDQENAEKNIKEIFDDLAKYKKQILNLLSNLSNKNQFKDNNDITNFKKFIYMFHIYIKEEIVGLNFYTNAITNKYFIENIRKFCEYFQLKIKYNAFMKMICTTNDNIRPLDIVKLFDIDYQII